MSCYKTPLGLRDKLGTHVEESMDSGEPNSKVKIKQLSGLAISNQGMVEWECTYGEKKAKPLREIWICRVPGTEKEIQLFKYCLGF